MLSMIGSSLDEAIIAYKEVKPDHAAYITKDRGGRMTVSQI